MKIKKKLSVAFLALFILQLGISQISMATIVAPIEHKPDKWKGLGLCVWPGETCDKYIRH